MMRLLAVLAFVAIGMRGVSALDCVKCDPAVTSGACWEKTGAVVCTPAQGKTPACKAEWDVTDSGEISVKRVCVDDNTATCTQKGITISRPAVECALAAADEKAGADVKANPENYFSKIKCYVCEGVVGTDDANDCTKDTPKAAAETECTGVCKVEVKADTTAKKVKVSRTCSPAGTKVTATTTDSLTAADKTFVKSSKTAKYVLTATDMKAAVDKLKPLAEGKSATPDSDSGASSLRAGLLLLGVYLMHILF